MYDRNTSIGQKQLILGSISLAVKELAGWLSDTPVCNSMGGDSNLKKKKNFQTKYGILERRRGASTGHRYNWAIFV